MKHITNEHGDCVPWCPACGVSCPHGENSYECNLCNLAARLENRNDYFVKMKYIEKWWWTDRAKLEYVIQPFFSIRPIIHCNLEL